MTENNEVFENIDAKTIERMALESWIDGRWVWDEQCQLMRRAAVETGTRYAVECTLAVWYLQNYIAHFSDGEFCYGATNEFARRFADEAERDEKYHCLFEPSAARRDGVAKAAAEWLAERALEHAQADLDLLDDFDFEGRALA